MAWMFGFMVFLYVNLTMMAMIGEGVFGVATTTLSGSLTASATTINVGSTGDFLAMNTIWIDDEEILFTGKTATSFTGVTRGVNGTKATSHATGGMVYSEPAGIVNQVAGFNVAEATTTLGTLKTVAMFPFAMAGTAARVLTWNYSWLDGRWSYLRYGFLYGLNAVFVVSLLGFFIVTFMSVARRP